MSVVPESLTLLQSHSKSLHHYVPSIKPLVSANKPTPLLTTTSLKVLTLKIVPEALPSLSTLGCDESKQIVYRQSKVV